MNILIVDDSAPMRRAIRSFVDDLVDGCHECEDGAEALAAYAACRPDWVLMDIAMKNVDGITATRQIVAAYPDAQVVIVTNYDHADLRAAASQAGARDYLVKENLLDVRRILGAG
jgi:DNA-binding NarL/FixJ family response regulator